MPSSGLRRRCRVTTNIILAGVGGQGLVLMTRILSEAALLDGHDVKTNDVIGLSQRGGMVWGTVRFGERILSANIPPAEADFIVALEPLEALRWTHMLWPEGTIIMNSRDVYPTIVQQEQMPYPHEAIALLSQKYTVCSVDASAEAGKAGNTRMANTFLLGMLSAGLSVSEASWHKAIETHIRKDFTEINLRAFARGSTYEDLPF